MTPNTPTAQRRGHEAAEQAGDGARRAKDSTPLDRLIRGGLIAYGVVHLLIGWLAVQLALGDSAGSADNQGALGALARTPLGRPLLWIVVIGFASLVIWQLAEAAVGHEDEQDERKRSGRRALSAGKAIVYGAIGVSAAKIAAGGGSSGGGSQEETWTARLMGAPAGQGLVALVGLAIVAAGAGLIYTGWTGRFTKQLEAGGTSGQSGTAIVWIGRAGHIAKGIALAVLGVLFVLAAVEHDPDKSGGLDDALRTMLGQPYGPVLVSVLGLGIASFGAYCFARARYLAQH